MSILNKLFANYGDDVARVAANKGDDALMALARTDYDTLIKNAQKQIDDIGKVSLFAKDADSIAKRAKLSELRDSIKAYKHGFDNIMDYNNSVAAKAANKTPYKAPTAAYSPNIGEKALNTPVEPGKTRLFRGLENDFDPSYVPQVSDNGFGYESWTDNYNLAKQYGDNIYAIDVPNEAIANDFITSSGDRNPLIKTDKNAGLNGISGGEYLLNVNDPLRESLTYSRVSDSSGVLNDLLSQNNGKDVGIIPETQSMLKKLLSGNGADKIYPRVDDDYFNMFTNQQFRVPYETPEDLAKVAAFKNIIESGGEITPIAVRASGNGQYAIDDGLHRMRAFYETGRQPLFRVFDNKSDSYNFADLWNKSKGNPI